MITRARVKRVFVQKDEKGNDCWMREYIWRDADRKIVRKEVRKSPCQANPLELGHGR